MSQSTYVKVQIGLTTISHTFGSGNISGFLGVYCVNVPTTISNPRQVLASTYILPPRELKCAQGILSDMDELSVDSDTDSVPVHVSIEVTRLN